MINIIGIIIGVLILIIIFCAFLWYRVVPPSEAHLITNAKGKSVRSADNKISQTGKAAYFKFPDFIPVLGIKVRKMDLTIKELVLTQETYEKNQARYQVTSSTKYRIVNVKTAAETFISDSELQKELKEVIQAAVRAITVQYDVIDARAKKREMAIKIREEIKDDFEGWGLELTGFQLVDFQDTQDSKIISNISRRREVEIEAETRERNAEKLKQAKIKEAETDQLAKEREIKRDEIVAMKEQDKKKAVAEQEKLAREKEYEVKRVEAIKQAEIDKEKAKIDAEKEKEVEVIMREKKRLEGEGDRLKQQEIAIGQAAPIREKGLAEAEAKEKLQQALNKFKPEAITALTAEIIVKKDEAVGKAFAESIGKSQTKIFLGGGSSQGFDLSSLLESSKLASGQTAESLLHRLKNPNDLGFGVAGIANLKENEKNIKK